MTTYSAVAWCSKCDLSLLASKVHANRSTSKHKSKHKLEKWFIISGDGVRTSVRSKHTKHRVKQISSYCFGWCLSDDSSLVIFFSQITLAPSTPRAGSVTSRARAATPNTCSQSTWTAGSGPALPTRGSPPLTSPTTMPTGAPWDSEWNNSWKFVFFWHFMGFLVVFWHFMVFS